MMAGELKVCYVSNIDGAHVPFMDFPRSQLGHAVWTVRHLAHEDALCASWVLKRGRKIIARIPRPHTRRAG